ncbi:MAG: hypothetical protein Q8O48_06680 [Anaerolineales bacterium]|nr:hypothetical protein [Anaerolineales bacterium]
MKNLLAFFFLLPFFTACAAPSPAPTQTSVVESTVLPTALVRFTPIPTFTAEDQAKVQPTTDFPTFAPPTAPPGRSNVIKFKANGTYADITDTIATGSSRIYSIKAMKGQIMSISILPQIPDGGWGYIPMQIKGADGSILCPQSSDSECIFWRGVLPSSQDYFVTLTPNDDVPQFVMRVAINPLGKAAQYFQYNNPATGVSLTYPDTFAPAIPVVGNYKTDPELALHLIDSKTYNKTNLSEVYLFISSTSDPQIIATCTKPNQSGGSPEQIVGNEVVNGFTFVHSTSEGAGAGNYYLQEIYRMAHKKVCYEVIYFIHSTNIGNYPPGVVTEFDRNALMQKLYGVFSTFTIK